MESTFMNRPSHAQDQLQELPPHLQGLVAVNTFSKSQKDATGGGKDASAQAACEDLATRAFTRLGVRQESQAILFLGDSGAGKSTLRKHVAASLLSMSSTPLSARLGHAEYIFDCLTSTKSATTYTASKAGLFFELQYDTTVSTHPTLIGGKILGHRLERSRIASPPPGERSYHVLYYLIAGATGPEKAHLGLDDSLSTSNRGSVHAEGGRRWRYLGHHSQLKTGINDAQAFKDFKTGLRKLEFTQQEIAEICQIIASVLHLGQLEFHSIESTTPAADESGGYSHEGGETVTAVKNKDTLGIIAAFLGVSAADLETCLGYKSKTIVRERVTVMLDPQGARENADDIARTLYSLLVTYITERINQRICAVDDIDCNTISLVDFPGFAPQSSTGSVLDQLLNNAACESLQNYCLQSFFERKSELLETEEITVPASAYFDNTDASRGLLKSGNGLLSILDDQMRRQRTDAQFQEAIKKRFEGKNPAISVSDNMTVLPGTNFQTRNDNASFTVKHYAGAVEYPIEGLLEENADTVSQDLINLVRTSKSGLTGSLFHQEGLNTVHHPQDSAAIMAASLSAKPTRAPSMARRNGERPTRFGTRRTTDRSSKLDNDAKSKSGRLGKSEALITDGAASQFLSALDTITSCLSESSVNSYFVYCLKPNDRRIAGQFDSKCVRNQLLTLGIPEISQRLRNADFSIFMPFSEFLGHAESTQMMISNDREKCEAYLDEKRWPINEARVGVTGVVLSERCWKSLAKITHDDITRGLHPSETDRSASPPNKLGVQESSKLLGTPSPMYMDDKGPGYFGGQEIDAKSDAGGSAFQGNMFRNMETREEMAEKGNEKRMEEIETFRVSSSRKRWVFFVWLLTFWMPEPALTYIGRMRRKEIRVAWREKLAINMIIWLSCGLVMFFIAVFPNLICPRQYVYTQAELSNYNGQNGASSYVSIRGVVIDLDSFLPRHYPPIIEAKKIEAYAGKDVTALFPLQPSALCAGKSGDLSPRIDASWQGSNYTGQGTSVSGRDPNAQYHDFRWAREDDYRPFWYTQQMLFLEQNYFKGRIGYPPSYLSTLADKGNNIASLNGKVYDFTTYINAKPPLQTRPGDSGNAGGDIDQFYMDGSLVALFQQFSGTDITQRFRALNLNPELQSRMTMCMDNLFYVGDVDTRSSTQCQFARYILLAFALLLVVVIGFKFLAALQFGKKNMPENIDKFIIATVPAYTEDEDSLRRAIDSAARMQYDDKRKLLIIVCDGMIIGQGNDRPTPRIVLDILGVPENVDPEPLSFESLGEGQRQHNMGKVYSGLYEVQGHIVPFLVIVKIGKPSEVGRPGNRGKRDSQMILMRFLNRVHYNLPMTPMELEMHHQIRNVIGVNPTFYEFLLQIDADTVVAADSATRFVSAFLHDTRLIGVCGETSLSNAKHSLVTMIQVYEYYISHNLTKAFESLFGSVTCLPGCFSMYRIRAAETGKPLFVSKEVVDAYARVRVDTLHYKNLLHLGEDRYLTTLLIKFHSKYKTKYIFRAMAWTIAPDTWTVFMSQRRRWINSTVHNLIELIPLQQLCGFCCFSMRFVVFLDLLSTVVQPTIIGYLIYLGYTVAKDKEEGGAAANQIPIAAFILLGAIYGLQAIIFILRRKWEMVGWMLIYILATPVFACALPLYAFWHMDDFSWGSTRVITGDNGKAVVISDEGVYDEKTIPKKRWEEYQAELWDQQTQRETDDDARSAYSGISYATKSVYPASQFGGTQMRSESALGIPRHQSQLSLGGFPSGPGSVQGYEMSELSQMLPNDDEILAEIRDILSKADLMHVTKKGVKLELENRFQCNLDAKKMYIGSATEAILGGEL